MKKTVKKLLALAIATAMTTNSVVFADNIAEGNSSEYDSLFDEYVLDLSDIEFQMYYLSQDNTNGVNDEKIEILQNRKNEIHQLMGNYDYDTMDDEALKNVLLNADYSNSEISRSTSMSDLNELVNNLKSNYNVVGRSASYNDGNKQYSLYVIVASCKVGNTISEEVLTKTNTKQFYGRVVANSTAAQNFVSEIIQCYLAKGLSSILEVIPYINYLPYEVFFSSKPSPNQISSSGNALVCTLSTNTTVAFTYVFDETKNTWVYCSACNHISAAFTETVALFDNNGGVTHKSKTNTEHLDGNYNTLRENAVTAFKAMQEHSYIQPASLGISKVRFQASKCGAYVENSVLNPRSPFSLA